MPSISALDYAFQNSVPQTALGIFLIGVVLAVDGFAFTATISFFRENIGQHAHPSKLRSTFFFVMCTQLLALIQLASICIWAGTLFAVGVSPDWFSALRLSASSYTTLGNFPGVMPDGWHMIPPFIAFSGLFSFAWAASSTISMLNSLNSNFDDSKNSAI